MARCGCAQPGGVCNCAVIGGDNVSVSGTGNPGSPYVISTADPGAARGYVEAEDSNSIDTTVSGTGTLIDPYQVRGDVILDPDDGNLLQITGDGLLLSCISVVSCVGSESPGDPGGLVNFGCGFDGDGTPGSPINLLPSCGFDGVQQTLAGPFNFPGGSAGTTTLDIENPSDCMDMLAIGFARVVCPISVDDGEIWELSVEYGWSGDEAIGTFSAGRAGVGGVTGEPGIVNTSGRPQFLVLGPSGTSQFSLRTFATGGVAGNTFENVRQQIDFIGILNPVSP